MNIVDKNPEDNVNLEPEANIPKKSIMKTSKYSNANSVHKSSSTFTQSHTVNLGNVNNQITSEKRISEKRAQFAKPDLAATAGPNNLFDDAKKKNNNRGEDPQILNTDESQDMNDDISNNLLDEEINSVDDSQCLEESDAHENDEDNEKQHGDKNTEDADTPRKLKKKKPLASSVAYSKKISQIQCSVSKDNYLEHLVKVLKVPPKQRSQQDIDILLKATVFLKFFLDMTKKKLDIEQQTHLKTCKVQYYEKFERGSSVVEVDELPTRFFVILDGLTGVYIKRKDQMENEQRIIGKIMEKIKLFEENKKKWKDLTEICTEPNGFSPEEITVTKSFKTVKNGFVEYTQEFHDKFLGGLAPDELDRRSILFNTDGTLKLMHVAQIPKGAVFGELGIIQKKRRAATILCKTTCEMGFITREDYDRILLEVEKTKMETKKRFFGVTVFKNSFSQDLAYHIGYMFEKHIFSRGEYVYRQGDKHTPLNKLYVYVIKHGSILAYVTEKFDNRAGDNEKIKALAKNVNCSKKRHLAYLSDGELFGDDEIYSGVCNVSMVCATETKVLRLDKDKWNKQMRDNKFLRDFVQERMKVKNKARNIWKNNQKFVEKMRMNDFPNDPNLKHMGKTEATDKVEARQYQNDSFQEVKDVLNKTTGNPVIDKNTRIDIISQNTGFLNKLRKINKYSKMSEYQQQYAHMIDLNNKMTSLDDTSLDVVNHDKDDMQSPQNIRKQYMETVRQSNIAQSKKSVDANTFADKDKIDAQTITDRRSLISKLRVSPKNFQHMKYVVHEQIKAQLDSVRSKNKMLESLRSPKMYSARARTLENETKELKNLNQKEYNSNIFNSHGPAKSTHETDKMMVPQRLLKASNLSDNYRGESRFSMNYRKDNMTSTTKNASAYEKMFKSQDYETVDKDSLDHKDNSYTEINQKEFTKSVKTDMRDIKAFNKQKNKKKEIKESNWKIDKTGRRNIQIMKNVTGFASTDRRKNHDQSPKKKRNNYNIYHMSQLNQEAKTHYPKNNSKENLEHCVKTRSLTQNVTTSGNFTQCTPTTNIPVKIQLSMNNNIFPVKMSTDLTDTFRNDRKSLKTQEICLNDDLFRTNEISDLKSKLEMIMTEKQTKGTTLSISNPYYADNKLEGENTTVQNIPQSTIFKTRDAMYGSMDEQFIRYDIRNEDISDQLGSEQEDKRSSKYAKNLISSKHNMFRMFPTINTNLINYKKNIHVKYKK